MKKQNKKRRYTVHYYDKYDYKLAANAPKVFSILHEMFMYLRSKSKYEGKYTEVYEELIRIMNDENFDIYES